jgi:hypothetical protein
VHNLTLSFTQVKKVKCSLVEVLRLCTGRTAHRGSRGIALLFHDHGTRRGGGVSVMPRPLFTPRKDPVPIVQEAGWAPGLVWTGAENLAPTRIQSPDRPAHSQSLYWLHYPAHLSLRATSILSPHQRLHLPNDLFPSDFLTRMLMYLHFLHVSCKSRSFIPLLHQSRQYTLTKATI